jgi:hypothetical protein
MVAVALKMGSKPLILLLQPRNHDPIVAHGCAWLRGMVASIVAQPLETVTRIIALSSVSGDEAAM